MSMCAMLHLARRVVVADKYEFDLCACGLEGTNANAKYIHTHTHTYTQYLESFLFAIVLAQTTMNDEFIISMFVGNEIRASRLLHQLYMCANARSAYRDTTREWRASGFATYRTL